MRRILILIIASSFLFSCASPRAWTRGEKVAAGYFLLGSLADFYTTERAMDYPDRFHETNFALGNHPNDGKVVMFFSLSSIAVLVIAHYNPDWRCPTLLGFGSIRGYAAYHNWDLMQ